MKRKTDYYSNKLIKKYSIKERVIKQTYIEKNKLLNTRTNNKAIKHPKSDRINQNVILRCTFCDVSLRSFGPLSLFHKGTLHSFLLQNQTVHHNVR